MLPRENYSDVATIDAEDVDGPRAPVRHFPRAPDAAVYRGVFGDLVRTLAPHTEADPVAILVQALAAFGSIVGRSARFVADGSPHYTNLFAVIVAASSKGRKGTSWAHVRNCFATLDPAWRCVSGLASGEGLIDAVRDPVYGPDPRKRDGAAETVLLKDGITDKRLLVLESEFARVLRVCDREGATLSPIIREAWDSGNLASLTKNSPGIATGAHVSIIGHVTAPELRRYLTATEAGNGFGNRFLWVCAKRSKYLPDGGTPSFAALEAVRNDFRLAVDHARQQGELRRDAAARDLWYDVYRELSDGRPGLLGSMTGRAEAQVMRLATLYALGDATGAILAEQLEAALGLWRYCFDSARYIFGDSLGDLVADDLRVALVQAGATGLTRSEMSREVFGRNRSKREIEEALALLQEHGLASCAVDRSGAGRPVERWFAQRLTN